MDDLTKAVAARDRAEASLVRANERLLEVCVEAARSGAPIRQLAKIAGVSKTVLYERLAERGVIAPTRPSMAGNRYAA